MNTTKTAFLFQAGTGVLRAKLAPEHTIYYGRIALPDVGQCYIDGVADKGAERLELDVRQAQTREIVAHISLPAGACKRVGDSVTTKIKVGAKRWAMVATLRVTEGADKAAKHHLALRLPDVKIQPGGANAF